MSRFLDGIGAVAFDAVGTLIFPNPGAATVYAEGAERHGIAVNPADIGPKLWAQFRIEEEADRIADWVTSEAREEQRWRNIVFAALPGATEELFRELYRHFSQPTAWSVPPAAAELLTELHRRGFLLGMASNYDSRLASVVNGNPSLAPVRDRLVISSLVGVRKPGRGFFTAGVLPAMGVPAAQILFVGDDHENDYLGATAAGLRAVLLDPKGKYPEVKERVAGLLELLD